MRTQHIASTKNIGKRISPRVQKCLKEKGYELIEFLPFYTSSGKVYRTTLKGRKAVVVGIYNLSCSNLKTGGSFTNYRGYVKFI